MTTMRKIEPSLELKNLSYAQNIPKILLEVISARTALIMLGMTYIVFFCSFAFDVYSTVQNFSDGINVVGTDSCNRISVDVNTMWDLGGKWGCTLRPYVVDQAVPGTWVGRIGNLTNVISVALRFNKLNITSLQLGNTYVPIADIPFDDAIVGSLNTLAVEYSLKLFACFHEDDCSRSGRDRGHTWHPVLTMASSSVVAEMLSPELNEVHHSVCGNTFQNQESLPTKGLVRSYLAIVEFWGNGAETVIEAGTDGSSYSQYEFLTISRRTSEHEGFIRPLLLAVTLCVAVSFLWTSFNNNPEPSSWLRERKWIVFYFFALIMYQNPAYIVTSTVHKYLVVRPSSILVFLTYTSDAFAQASFFLIWLLFADGSNSRNHHGSFYFPKIFLSFCIFLTNMAILVMQFPSLFSSLTLEASSPTLAVYNWSDVRKLLFISFSLTFLFLLIIWSIFWYHILRKTSRTLEQLPYMSTRYLQLSFRFFSLQASLVAIYYLFEYGVVILLIMRNSPPVLNQHLNNISDNVNTLFRHQTLLVGKVVFLTVYSIILAFLYLPATDGGRGVKVNETLSVLSATFTIHEVEMLAVARARKKIMKKQIALSNIVDTKAEVFCVNLALFLLDAANEAYYDASKKCSSTSPTAPVQLIPSSDSSASSMSWESTARERKWSDRPTVSRGSTEDRSGDSQSSSSSGEPGTSEEPSLQSGSYGAANWEKYGYEIIDQKYHASHDTYVYIGRHIESDKIIVAFRGTSSTKHWKNNFQYGLKEVDLMKMPLPSIDENDNLDIGQYIDLNVHGADSSEGSDSDEDDEEEGLHKSSSALESLSNIESDGPSPYPGSGISYGKKRRRRRRSKKRGLESTPVGLVADTVREVGDAVLGATSTVMGATTGLIGVAVAHTPIINKTVKAFVHSGFWDCYFVVREFIHEVLRKEMTFLHPEKSKNVYFTGHSLGGVIACFAALDFTLYSKNRIDKFIRHKKLSVLDAVKKGISLSRGQRCGESYREVSVGMYSYGAPKPGNWKFCKVYDKYVPNSFRVVVDGDIVSGLPPTMGYQHIGTQVVIDKACSGSIIVDPSFVERRLRTSTKTSITAHILAVYKQSLVAIRDASLYIQQIGTSSMMSSDSLDGREEFNRAQTSDDLFFLEKIYELLNKKKENRSNAENFSELPQDSDHSFDNSEAVPQSTLLDVSIRESSWKSTSAGNDDVFTLNTSDHNTSDHDTSDQSSSSHSSAHLFESHPPVSEEMHEGAPFELDPTRRDEDSEPPDLSSSSKKTFEVLFNAPFIAFNKFFFGIEENSRVNESEIESIVLMQRSSMQRSESI